jgi:prevent-host-death family protein
MSTTVNIAEAKAKLSALIDQALAGEEVVLARAGKPIARIVPLARREPRRPGLLRHWGGDPSASLEGISDEELAAMEREWEQLFGAAGQAG